VVVVVVNVVDVVGGAVLVTAEVDVVVVSWGRVVVAISWVPVQAEIRRKVEIATRSI
jgi:hypothetical protein